MATIKTTAGMTKEQMLAYIAELEAGQAKPRAVSCKVSPVSGALSVYGINVAFPVTLFASQWERLLDHAEAIRAFIKANDNGTCDGPAPLDKDGKPIKRKDGSVVTASWTGLARRAK